MKAIRIITSTVIAIAITIYSLSSFAIPTTAESLLLGDTDCNGSIDITDATLIQRDTVQLISLEESSRKAADVDADGKLTVLDVSCIQRWLVNMYVKYSIGEPLSPTQPQTASISSDGKTATIDDISFNVAKLPDTISITDSNKESGTTLMIVPKSNVDYHDMTTVVNNGNYQYIVDYTDSKFKESYLIEKDNGILFGYDCTVRDTQENELAYVYAHYKSGLYYPYQTTILCLEGAHESFPIDFYYKDVLIKRVMININTSSGPSSIESSHSIVREIENKCWKDSMSLKEKMKAFGEYISDHFTYNQVMCVTGAIYTAFAARDLGLGSMLLYPGGEPTQLCDRHIITYNLYGGTAVPGGHCACLVEYDNGIVRYDVQGGLYRIRDYQFPY